MALTAQSNITAILLRKSLDRQAALAQARLKFKPQQVENILRTYGENTATPQFTELLKILQTYVLTDENFKCVIEDVLNCVVLFGKNCTVLVKVLCGMEWVTRNDELVELYSRFLINLVTAHPYHCHMVMTLLVKLFSVKDDHWEEKPSAELVRKWSHVHSVIAQIVAFMPMTSDLLLRVVIENFPYFKTGSFSNRAYIHNLIWMTKYLPALRDHLMTAIINKMIVMDVNIAELEKNKPQETQFEMDVENVDEIQNTLDYCMLEVLRWLEDEKEPVMGAMCNIFERIVLPTYGIRHVQFLLLYTISISQQCLDRVLNNLWAVAAGLQGLGPGALATRRTAASHLAGLLARSVRIPNTRLIQHLRAMTEWCHSYITATQESTTCSENVKAHGAFYAICHSVFYLVAFKHHHLFATKDNVNFIESLNLPRLVTCPLNPLRTCPPQVTRAFSSITRSHQVVYCQPIIEKNQRNTLISVDTTQFDEWFPYDPYMLPRSGKIIWPLCIDYKDWLKEGDDETQYTSMKRKMDAEEDDFLMSSSPSMRIANLSTGKSPGFRTSENILMQS